MVQNSILGSLFIVIIIFLGLFAYTVFLFFFLTNEWYDNVFAVLYYSPNGNFLPIIITFYVGILSFMIPVTIQMLSSIRSSFPTKQVEDRFKNEITFKVLPILLLVQIVGLILFEVSIQKDTHYPMAMFVIFMGLILTAILIYLHIRMMIKYTEKETVIYWLIGDTKRYLETKKGVNDSKISLRSLCDIVVEEINDKPNYELINSIFSELNGFYNKFIPQATNLIKIDNDERYSYFTELTVGSEKIIKKCMDIENNDIILEAKLLLMYDVIDKIISKPQNFNYLEKLFEHHRELFLYSLKTNSVQRFYFSFRWYSSIVFKWYDKTHVFNPEYLQTFDKQVFYYLREIVRTQNYELFEDFISWAHEGIGFPNNNYLDIYSYTGLGNFDSYRLQSLEEEYNQIDTINKLDSFLVNFNLLKEEVIEQFPSEKNQILDRSKEIISSAHQTLFFNNFIKMVHGVFSYCLYYKKYDFISLAWDYKDPKDSESHWIGHDIYPQTIKDIILLFKKQGHRFHRKFTFNEAHHNGEYYEMRYELYLLGYLIYTKKDDNIYQKFLSGISDASYLQNLKYNIEHYYMQITKEIYVIDNLPIFQNLFSKKVEKRDIHILKDQILLLLDQLIVDCTKIIDGLEITKILSADKIKSFKASVIHELESSGNRLVELLKLGYGIYKIVDDTRGQERGLNIFLDRFIFFDTWHIGNHGYERELAKSILRDENYQIFNFLKERCEEVEDQDLSSVLDDNTSLEDVFIVMLNSHGYFRNNKYFKESWREDIEKIKNHEGKQLDSFTGYLSYKDLDIPVFKFYDPSGKDEILILNKKNFIEFVQCKITDRNNVENEIYYFDISELSQEQIDEIKKNNSDSEFQKKINMKLLERYYLNVQHDFQGYRIKL